MACFIASKCFAAKTGFPNRGCEAGGSGLSNCGRSSSWGHACLTWWWWRNPETGSVPQSLRIRRVRLRTCWWTVFLFIQELILYSFVKRKEVLIFGYFAEPLGCFCLPVPELLICLKLVLFCFFYWGKNFPLSEISLWICQFSLFFFNKKPCFKEWVILHFILFPYRFYKPCKIQNLKL